jgi:hypothetical protein
MKGHKRYRSGAWRLVVLAGTDLVTVRHRSIYPTVSAPNNRSGAKLRASMVTCSAAHPSR